MLPPKDIDTGCLMEIVMTGDRTLKLCAADPDQSRFVQRSCYKALKQNKSEEYKLTFNRCNLYDTSYMMANVMTDRQEKSMSLNLK